MNGSELAAWVGAIAGAIGALTGIPALILNYLTRRDMQLNERPIVIVREWGGTPQVEGWHTLRVTLRSRSNLGYKVDRIFVTGPSGAKIADYAPSGTTDSGLTIYEATTPARDLAMDLAVAHAGQEAARQSWGGYAMGSGEEHHEQLLLSLPDSAWSRSWFSRWSDRSDASQICRVSFKVRLIDHNAVISDHKRTITLTRDRANKAISNQ